MKNVVLFCKLILVCLLFVSAELYADTVVADITADDWSRPRSAEMLVQIPALRNIITHYNQQPVQQLLLRYPGGEEGLLWANELKDWLVSLGIPSGSIQMESGHSDIGKVSLILGSR